MDVGLTVGRTAIVGVLAKHGGAVEDSAGLATRVAVDSAREGLGGDSFTIRSIKTTRASVEEAGMVDRDVRGRRVCKIAVTDAALGWRNLKGAPAALQKAPVGHSDTCGTRAPPNSP